MKFTNLIHISKGTRVVFIITLCICGSAFAIASLYYRSVNRSGDPRLIPVRNLIQQADSLSGGLNAPRAQVLLDSARRILGAMPGYRDSWEVGVILNNSASGWIMAALYDSTLTADEKVRMLTIGLQFTDSSLTIYKEWLAQWESMSEEMIRKEIQPWFLVEDQALTGLSSDKLITRRTRQILEAKLETPRRISVALTNRGTAFRHLIRLDSARLCFEQAMEIWPDNQAAKNNLSILDGGKPIRPSLLKTLFPPEKNAQIK